MLLHRTLVYISRGYFDSLFYKSSLLVIYRDSHVMEYGDFVSESDSSILNCPIILNLPVLIHYDNYFLNFLPQLLEASQIHRFVLLHFFKHPSTFYLLSISRNNRDYSYKLTLVLTKTSRHYLQENSKSKITGYRRINGILLDSFFF